MSAGSYGSGALRHFSLAVFTGVKISGAVPSVNARAKDGCGRPIAITHQERPSGRAVGVEPVASLSEGAAVSRAWLRGRAFGLLPAGPADGR